MDPYSNREVRKKIAPLAIVGLIGTIISGFISLISIVIDVIKYTFCYSLFFLIAFIIGLNAFKGVIRVLDGFDVLDYLSVELVRALNCDLPSPE